MSVSFRSEKLKYFLFGILVAALVVLLMGAVKQQTPGRYQIDAWGANGIGFGVFVVDTATGETKSVYLNTGRDAFQSNYLGKAFQEIKPPGSSGYTE